MSELTKKAEAILQDLSLSRLADLVVEICRVIEKPEIKEADKPEVKDIKKKK